eukprot:1152001-Pelagomonas_calceolata.AAC.4
MFIAGARRSLSRQVGKQIGGQSGWQIDSHTGATATGWCQPLRRVQICTRQHHVLPCACKHTCTRVNFTPRNTPARTHCCADPPRLQQHLLRSPECQLHSRLIMQHRHPVHTWRHSQPRPAPEIGVHEGQNKACSTATLFMAGGFFRVAGWEPVMHTSAQRHGTSTVCASV